MANNPYVNKVVFGSATLVDLTGTTATADKILQGYGAYGADGAWMDGTASGGGSIRLQEKSVTPSSVEQIITPDKITYDFEIQVGAQNDAQTGNTLRWSVTPEASLVNGNSYDWAGEVTASDGTVITISGTYTYNIMTTISSYTVSGPSTVSSIFAMTTTLYIEFSGSAPASATVTEAILAHPHGQEDYDGLSKVTVAAVAPTASSYTLLGSHEFTVSTTSTSAASVGTFTVPTTVWTKDKAIYVCIRDKAGKRAGYFYGTDNWFINLNVQTGSTSAFTAGLRYIRRYSSSSVFGQTQTSSTTGYGVYAYSIAKNGTIAVYSRYNSTYSLTINGTYVVEVYTLDLPGGTSPFA